MNTEFHTHKINVALVIPSLCYGGAERQVTEIARKLDRNRFEVHIIILTDYTPLLTEDDELRRNLHVVEKSGKLPLSVVWRLRTLFIKLNIQMAHSFLFYAEIATRIAAKMAGVEFVIGSERNTDYKLAIFREKLLYMTRNMTNAIIANSQAGAKFHSKLYNLPGSKYWVVTNGIDIQRFRVRDKIECKKKLGFGKDTILIGMFASFKTQKNHLQLFTAMKGMVKKFNKVHLLLVGDTLYTDFGNTLEYNKQVMKAMKDTGIDQIATILGNRTDVETIYPACDFTVLPSFREGTPNVVLESLACGVPVVVTDVSDNVTLVTNGEDGFVVPINNVPALQSRIEELCMNAELRTAMGKRARQTAERRFSTQVMCDNMGAAYEAIIQAAS